jgi:hypothetical protein
MMPARVVVEDDLFFTKKLQATFSIWVSSKDLREMCVCIASSSSSIYKKTKSIFPFPYFDMLLAHNRRGFWERDVLLVVCNKSILLFPYFLIEMDHPEWVSKKGEQFATISPLRNMYEQQQHTC